MWRENVDFLATAAQQHTRADGTYGLATRISTQPLGLSAARSSVQDVSANFHMKFLAFIILLPFIASCSHYSPIYWGWGEWVDPEVVGTENSFTADLDWHKLPGVIVAVDGKNIGKGYKKAKLRQGVRRIEYAYYPAEFGTHPKGMFELPIVAGHSYEFRIELCYWCAPRKYSVWVIDQTTGEVVWGEKPTWPSWWL